MRNIKLKIWNSKEVVDVKSIDFDDAGNLYHINNELVNPFGVELIQNTELRDTNGTEIYMGDILEWEPSLNVTAFRKGVVFYSEGTYRVKKKDDGMSLELGKVARYHNCKIIGNIYENPELL